MALNLAQLATILTPTPSPTEGSRAAMQGFGQLTNAMQNSRELAFRQKKQAEDLALQQRQQDEVERAQQAQEAMARWEAEQAKRGELAKSLSENYQALIDPTTRDAAIGVLTERGWKVGPPEQASKKESPTGAPVPLPPEAGGIGLPGGAEAFKDYQPKEGFDAMIGDLAATGGMATPSTPEAPVQEPPKGLIIESPYGQKIQLDPDATAEQISQRVESVMGELGAGATKDKDVYQQVQTITKHLVETEGYSAPEAEKVARDYLMRLLQMRSNERAAANRAQQHASGAEAQLADDAVRDFQMAVKNSGADQTLNALKSVDKAVQQVEEDPSSPAAWGALKYGLAQARDSGKLSDRDIQEATGETGASIIDRFENFVTRGLVGGPGEIRREDVLSVARRSAQQLRSASLQEYEDLAAHRDMYSSRGAVPNPLAYHRIDLQLKGLYGRQKWFKAAEEEKRGAGRSGQGGGGPSSAGAEELGPNAKRAVEEGDNLATAPAPKIPLVPGARKVD